MTYSTIGGQVTRGECYAKMIHHLREAQECAAMLGHLHNTEDSQTDRLFAKGWLGVSELIARMIHQVTEFAKRGMQ